MKRWRWKAVPGFEGLYEVSDRGRVRSLWTRNARVNRPRKTPRILACTRSGTGYPEVDLRKTANKRSRYKVHALVLMTFVGPRPSGFHAAHLNGKRDDNRLSNLRWTTVEENQSHRWEHGTASFGESHGNAKLTEKAVRDMRRMRAEGFSHIAIAERFGVTKSTSCVICSGKSWGHVV
jgi:hypothetical protein